MTDTRVDFVRNALVTHYGLDATGTAPLQGLCVADIGCGGGLFSEPLAKLGANVVGIDASVANIATAQAHIEASEPVAGSVEYRAMTAEELVGEGAQFDAVCSLEVVEHVADA